jgi:hypothetical protein
MDVRYSSEQTYERIRHDSKDAQPLAPSAQLRANETISLTSIEHTATKCDTHEPVGASRL